MQEELKVLSHDPWPGFKKAFMIVFAALGIYLAVILLSTPDGGHMDPSHHGESDNQSEPSGH